MIDAIDAARAALHANQQWLDSISANVANLNTPAYKAQGVEFRAAVAGGLDASANGLVVATPRATDLSAGDIRQTGRELDVAIRGNGFLRVSDGDGGVAYTRLGRLVVNGDGLLAIADGRALADDIAIPADALSVSVSDRGDVSARLPGESAPVMLGTIRLAHVTNLSGLVESGSGVFVDADRALSPEEGTPGTGVFGALAQGHLELSNVNLVDEMTQLVLAQRAYQLNARVLQAGDAALETINNLRR